MAEPYLSEIRIFSFNFPPKGWALCSGQVLSINQNQALFSLLGTTYGGDGSVNFALPNLQGRVPIHMGNNFVLGQMGGAEINTLTINEIPAHSHTVGASSGSPNAGSPAGNVWASNTGYSPYANSVKVNESMYSAALDSTGGNQAHNNMSPFLTLNFCIALQGIFPSRN